MERLGLLAIKNVILKDHTYLRIGDIVQVGVKTVNGIDLPILDYVEDAHDPLLDFYNLNGAQRYGNVYLGDNLAMIEHGLEHSILAKHSSNASSKDVRYMTQQFNQHKPSEYQTSSNQNFFNIKAKKFIKLANGKIKIVLLLVDHQTKETKWAYRIFSYWQNQALESFKKNIKDATTVRGVVESSGWIKYLYPVNKK